jgi:hypothetical protein
MINQFNQKESIEKRWYDRHGISEQGLLCVGVVICLQAERLWFGEEKCYVLVRFLRVYQTWHF